jgi:soluble lytic murein transglycosylase-like protein
MTMPGFPFRMAVLAPLLALAVSGCTQSAGPNASALLAVREAPSEYAPSRSSYDDLIARHAAENGVPLEMARAVVEMESGYNARATGRGTVGLMQIKPATARGIGYRGSSAGLYDPDTNLKWGMRYLGDAYKLGGGDTCGTALRYQGGHRATRMSEASRRYCAKLKATMAKKG